MSNLSVLNFHNSNVRIQLANNEPLFCLSDVTEILNVKNPHTSRFKLSEKGIHKMYTLTNGGKQELIFINEPNLYRVIFRSNKKEAIDFQNWVFDEVLPSIRKNGSYSLTINTEQQHLIRKAVDERVHRTGEHHQSVYSRLYNAFKIPSYKDLPASKFNDAIGFLGGDSKQVNFRAVNIDNLKVCHNYIATIQEYQYRIYDHYNHDLADFLSKNIPHLHYNISMALQKIQSQCSLGLNFTKRELDTLISRDNYISFKDDIPYLD